jgi:hypothetical protein
MQLKSSYPNGGVIRHGDMVLGILLRHPCLDATESRFGSGGIVPPSGDSATG